MRILCTATFLILLAAGCSPREHIANFQASGCYRNSHGAKISINGTLFEFKSKINQLRAAVISKEDKLGNILSTKPSIIFKIDRKFNVVALESNDIATDIRVSNSKPLALTVTDLYSGRHSTFISSSC